MAEASSDVEPQVLPKGVMQSEKTITEGSTAPETSGVEVGSSENIENNLEAPKDVTSNKAEELPRGTKRSHTSSSAHYRDKKHRKGNVSELVSKEKSDDPVAIRKQVEFYFSDSNLAQDKFLFTQVDGHKNNPVPVSTIHNFKRMRHFQPFSAVVDALRESTVLDIIQDGETASIRRKLPLPENLKGKTQYEVRRVIEDATMARSVYVKGFGDEQPDTQFVLEAFFNTYAPTNQVRLRRADDKTFKGSVFVEFDSVDSARKFVGLEPKPQYHDKELLIMSKKQYCDEKVEVINAGKVRPDDQDWRKRRDADMKNGLDKGSRRSNRGGRGKRGRGGNQHRHEGRRRGDQGDEEKGPLKTESDAQEAPAGEEAETTEGRLSPVHSEEVRKEEGQEANETGAVKAEMEAET